jgi:dihydrofolate synthase/folylpolyglutamate synthase
VAPHATGPYRDALEQLFARTAGGSRYGLERTRAFLEVLRNPQHAFPVFHVAGTNGKGSTVATLAALLAARGLRVGRYTSPHLVDFRERIVVDGRAISEEEVVAFVREHSTDAERCGATFFEFTTGMAFEHFARASVDVAIVETGLGGRLDSTNVVEPLVAGVTSIGLDHTELLGDTLAEIAHEKAGIFKRGAAAVIGERSEPIATQLVDEARAVGASVVRVVRAEIALDDIRVEPTGTSFDVAAPFGSARLTTPLLGRFQAENAATALTMLDAAGAAYALPIDTIARSLADVRLPGRYQRVGQWIFDVAHNPDGARVLGDTLRAVEPPRPIAALIAVLADKDWVGILDAIAPAVDHLVLTTAPTAPANRVWDPVRALDHARARGWSAELVVDFDAALARVATQGATALVAGSFHTVGDAMARLQVDPLAR